MPERSVAKGVASEEIPTAKVPADEVEGQNDGSSSSSSDEDDEDPEPSDLSGEEEVDVEPDLGPSVLKDVVIQAPRTPCEPAYPGDWRGSPQVGCCGFNAFAAKAMRAAGIASRPAGAMPEDATACPPLQPHQEVVKFLLHPQSPVSRLLVDHPTGSGKTREMISVLDNFFQDPRPKVPIFPKEPVCRNFYAELLRWPCRYRDFFSCLRPRHAAQASGSRDWRSRRGAVWDLSELSDVVLRELCTEAREVLEMKGWFYMGKMRRDRQAAFQQRFPNELLMAAPLRALRYTSAGGKHTELRGGWPISALLKVEFDRAGKNVYSNKIVLMDEAHNLVRTQTQYGEQLARLRELLHGARGMVLAGFTGTPILSEPCEGQQLLDIVKGHGAQSLDQGFLSSFPMRPPSLFPRSLPRGVPDAVLTPKLRRQVLQRVQLGGESLKRYDAKRFKGLPQRRLQRYCSLAVHFGSFHGGKSGSKASVLGHMQAYAPKLHAIAATVGACPDKALILIARSSGMEALLEHLREVAKSASPAFNVATMDEIAAFNSAGNLRGEIYRVMVADATQCSEGVSFFAVRQVHLADVPVAPSALVQSVGRSIRMYGHRGLPEEERTVTTSIWIAGFPRWMRSSLGAWAFRAQRKRADAPEMESKTRKLLRQFMKAGINDLTDLKKRVDAIADSRAKKSLPRDPSHNKGAPPAQPPEKEPLETSQIAGLFEQLGLLDEARAVRARQQRMLEAKASGRQARRRQARSQAAPSKQQQQTTPQRPRVGQPAAGTPPPLGRPRPKGVGPRAAEEGDADAEMTLADIAQQAKREKKQREKAARRPPVPVEETAPQTQAATLPVLSPFWNGDPLARAVQLLHLAASAEEAAAAMCLSPETADEEAFRFLSQRSREFVPALVELRSRAVDREVLQCLGGDSKAPSSEGESSAQEFGVSSSGGSEAEVPDASMGSKKRRKEAAADLLLPEGWRTEKFQRRSREVREFVDPSGRRYRTVPEARKAVDAVRARVNVERHLRDRYAAGMLGHRGGAVP